MDEKRDDTAATWARLSGEAVRFTVYRILSTPDANCTIEDQRLLALVVPFLEARKAFIATMIVDLQIKLADAAMSPVAPQPCLNCGHDTPHTEQRDYNVWVCGWQRVASDSQPAFRCDCSMRDVGETNPPDRSAPALDYIEDDLDDSAFEDHS